MTQKKCNQKCNLLKKCNQKCNQTLNLLEDNRFVVAFFYFEKCNPYLATAQWAVPRMLIMGF